MSQSVASEVVSAMVGGIFSASALYPLEVLKTRMQAETKVVPAPPPPPPRGKTKDDEDDEGGGEDSSSAEEEDVVPPPPHDKRRLQQEERTSGDANNDANRNDEKKKKAEEEELRRRYAHAASRGMAPYATLMYENEGGISPFYSGVLTSAIQSATEKALYFFAYTFYKNG
jgi:hypothetical protein